MSSITMRLRFAVGGAVALLALAACSTTAPSTTSGGYHAEKGCKVGMLPKTTADPNFQAMAKGGNQAADELGYQLDFNGPTTLDSAGQIQFIEQWTRQKYCGITISANDPDALVPAVTAAQKAGVAVTTFDAAVNSNDVVHLAPFSAQGMGEALADEIIHLTSPTAKIYILTSSLTAPNQSSWIDELKKVMTQKYPNAVIQTIQPGEGDTQKSYNTAKAWLQANPDTNGVLALDGNALQGASQAIQSLGLTGKVALTGIGVPSQNKTALLDGIAASFFLYDSPKIGYSSVQVLSQVMSNKIKPGSSSVDVPNVGTLNFTDQKTVLYGPPQKFTKDNVNDFQF